MVTRYDNSMNCLVVDLKSFSEQYILKEDIFYEHKIEFEDEDYKIIKRKHLIQMTKEEELKLISFIKKISQNKINYSFHAKKRMKERDISKEEIEEALDNFSIIEYREIEKSKFVTIKGNLDCIKGQVNIVINLNKKEIITTYYKKDINKLYLDKYEENLRIKLK